MAIPYPNTPPPPPAFVDKNGTIPQIVPPHAPTGTQITLNGLHFTGVNRVAFLASPVVYATLASGDLVSVTDTVIKVNVPAALSGAVHASMQLTVSVDGVSGMTATSDLLFTVDPQPIPQPAFAAPGSQITTSPPTHPVQQSRGSPVTLNGSNFGSSTATTSVRFKGTNTVPASASDYISVTPTTISVRVPAALTVAAAPNNLSQITVIVQNVESLPSNDLLLVV